MEKFQLIYFNFPLILVEGKDRSGGKLVFWYLFKFLDLNPNFFFEKKKKRKY